MPLVIHPRVRKAAGRVAAFTCVAVFASTGAALAACSPPSVTTPFAQWGDSAQYFPVPGGTFQGSDVGWSLQDATLTPGGSPFNLDGGASDQSLTIDAQGSATSPSFCVDRTVTDVRFLAREADAGSDLKVDLLVATPAGDRVRSVGTVPDGSLPSWGPVAPLALRVVRLPGWVHRPAAVRLSVPGQTGRWQIDDVYVDPYRG